MLKEISEQPDAVASARCAAGSTTASTPPTWAGSNMDAREARAIRRVKILGCGSAYYAGQIGAQLIEELARIPADAEPASRVPLPQPGGRAGHPLRRGQPVRRDLRHPRRRPGAQAQGRPGARHRQRRRQRDRPRVRRRRLPARGPRGLGGVDQGVHLDRRGLRAARAAPGPGPRPVPRRRPADRRGPAEAARPDRGDPRRRSRRSRSWPPKLRRQRRA